MHVPRPNSPHKEIPLKSTRSRLLFYIFKLYTLINISPLNIIFFSSKSRNSEKSMKLFKWNFAHNTGSWGISHLCNCRQTGRLFSLENTTVFISSPHCLVMPHFSFPTGLSHSFGLLLDSVVISSTVVSFSWPPERGRPSTTIRSWRRSSSTTRRSDASLTTDIYPRASTTRPRSCAPWRRLAVGSTFPLC